MTISDWANNFWVVLTFFLIGAISRVFNIHSYNSEPINESITEEEIIECLRNAIQYSGSVMPKVIDVANEVNPLSEPEKYAAYRRMYIKGFNDYQKQLEKTFLEEVKSTIERKSNDI